MLYPLRDTRLDTYTGIRHLSLCPASAEFEPTRESLFDYGSRWMSSLTREPAPEEGALLTFHSLGAVLFPPRHDWGDCCRTDGGLQRCRTSTKLSQNVELFVDYLFIIKNTHALALQRNDNYINIHVVTITITIEDYPSVVDTHLSRWEYI